MAFSQKSPVLALLVGSTLLALAACSGGSGGGNSPAAANPPPSGSSYTAVPGPLDALQEPLSTQVFDSLATAFAGTPMEGAIDCLNQLAVAQLPDVLDAILVQVSPGTLSDPQALFAQAEPDLEMLVASLQWQLLGLQATLTGETCSGDSAGDDPLAGTALAPLGEALAQVLAGTPGSDLTSLAAYVSDLSAAFDSGLAAIGAGDQAIVQLPILNGLILTVQTALSDLDALLAAASAADPVAAHAALVLTLENLLQNLLTRVVPVVDIETLSGQPGLVSDLINAEIGELTALFGGDFSGVLDSGFDTGLESAANDLVSPFAAVLLPGLLDAITGELAAVTDSGTTGTPLDATVDPLTAINDLLTAGGTPTGTPLDFLLTTIVDALLGGDTCPAVGSYLDPLCGLVQGLLDALALNPDADPLPILDGLINTLFGGLV